MNELSDTELALLDMLVTKPRALLPPHICVYAEHLSQFGFAMFSEGQWFVTAKGLNLTHHSIH